MIKKPAAYLDKILNILAEDFNKFYSIQELQNKMTPIEIFGKTGDVKFSEDLLIDLRKAIEYLYSHKFVEIDPIENKLKITFEGFMKIKTKGFVKEINEKSINQVLQRIAWVIPIIISVIALSISIFKNSSNLNTNEEKKIKFHEKIKIIKNIPKNNIKIKH